jgi:hypothetical protein
MSARARREEGWTTREEPRANRERMEWTDLLHVTEEVFGVLFVEAVLDLHLDAVAGLDAERTSAVVVATPGARIRVLAMPRVREVEQRQ